MTRLLTKHLTITDHCTRCPLDRPSVHPDGMGSTTDSVSVVLLFRCPEGHCWERSFRRADLTHRPAKATTPPRRHVANRPVTAGTPTPTTTTDADRTDEANLLSKAERQPGPRTRWCPDLRTWQPR